MYKYRIAAIYFYIYPSNFRLLLFLVSTTKFSFYTCCRCCWHSLYCYNCMKERTFISHKQVLKRIFVMSTEKYFVKVILQKQEYFCKFSSMNFQRLRIYRRMLRMFIMFSSRRRCHSNTYNRFCSLLSVVLSWHPNCCLKATDVFRLLFKKKRPVIDILRPLYIFLLFVPQQ